MSIRKITTEDAQFFLQHQKIILNLQKTNDLTSLFHELFDTLFLHMAIHPYTCRKLLGFFVTHHGINFPMKTIDDAFPLR